MGPAYVRSYDFSQPLDDCWEVIPDQNWSFDMSPGCARFANRGEGKAEVYQRPCCLPGDTLEIRLVPGAPRSGMLSFGFQVGFEYARFELDLSKGALAVRTHEFHKEQPRLAGKVQTGFRSIRLVREPDALPGLPYEGSRIVLLLDDEPAGCVGEVDLLPECLCAFGLIGPGEARLASWSVRGGARPRPEYVRVGLWQQSVKPTTRQNVDALIAGVQQAAEAGVEILASPETSLTGLRPGDPELDDRGLTRSELCRFQRSVARVHGAPHTLIGYPDWVPGEQVEGSTVEHVKVNRHVFVRPDGTLGPPMAKVHSCEEGFWHGRCYNLQRVRGVEVAVGVCHDARYDDVFTTGVMGGARLCLHPSAGGNYSGSIEDARKSHAGAGTRLDAFWVHVNAGGNSAIVYPQANAKVRDTLLAVPDDMTQKNPTYPAYSHMGDQLAHARIRLYDATGCWPMRTLRGGSRVYEAWSRLIPRLAEA